MSFSTSIEIFDCDRIFTVGLDSSFKCSESVVFMFGEDRFGRLLTSVTNFEELDCFEVDKERLRRSAEFCCAFKLKESNLAKLGKDWARTLLLFFMMVFCRFEFCILELCPEFSSQKIFKHIFY